jgi:flagellar basal-body rod protein FlgF
MLKGIYTAAAGMLSTNMAIDTVASNLANVSTVGFKGSKVNFQTFPEMLMKKVSDLGETSLGGISTGTQVYESFVNQAPGATRNTGNPFDAAIQGNGMFTIKSGNGDTFYTRAGNFTVDSNGYLSTNDGQHVQGKGGDIQLNMSDGPFQIMPNGDITAKGTVVDQLQITQFSNPQSLQKVSDNLYAASSSTKSTAANTGFGSTGYTVAGGALEDSNVNPVMEMVNTIQGQRLYEALQKNIHMHNDTLGKAVNDVGRWK